MKPKHDRTFTKPHCHFQSFLCIHGASLDSGQSYCICFALQCEMSPLCIVPLYMLMCLYKYNYRYKYKYNKQARSETETNDKERRRTKCPGLRLIFYNIHLQLQTRTLQILSALICIILYKIVPLPRNAAAYLEPSLLADVASKDLLGIARCPSTRPSLSS